MEPVQVKPRNGLVLILGGLLLGAPSIMLWLGKWKAALAYVLASAAASALLLAFLYSDAATSLRLPVDMVWIIGIPVALAGIIHAFAIRKTALVRTWYSHWYIALVAPTAVMLAAGFAIRVFAFQPFYVPSGSNEPNLMVGDHFFVSKTAYGYSRFSFPDEVFNFEGRTGSGLPQRGDMAVFRSPQEPGNDYIKRVIGLPGDRVQIQGGVVHINGSVLPLAPVVLPPAFDPAGSARFFRETLPDGRSYVIQDMTGSSAGDNTEVYEVPAGHYFMLGDNRDNSMDSRFPSLGSIPADHFVGRISFRFWNSEGFPLGNRPVEIFPTD